MDGGSTTFSPERFVQENRGLPYQESSHSTCGTEQNPKKPKLTEDSEASSEGNDPDQVQWKCNICDKVLSRKQRLESHLSSVHSTTDGRPHQKYKKYETNSSASIPERTLRRHQQNVRLTKETEVEELAMDGEHSGIDPNQSGHVPVIPGDSDNDIFEETIPISSEDCSTDDDTVDPGGELNLISDSAQNECAKDVETEDEGILESSDTSSNCSFPNVPDDRAEDLDVNYPKADTFVPPDQPTVSDKRHVSPESIAVMSYILRHKVNNAAATDMYRLYHVLQESKKTDFKITESLGGVPVEYFDVCTECGSTFPEDKSVYECTATRCTGLRFKGSLHEQHKQIQKCSLATLSIEQQLKELLKQADIQQAIRENKNKSTTGVISDISGGVGYKTAVSSLGQVDADVLTLCFNTDGALLYKSSHVNLWPVFLVVNELPPKMRFSRKNMLIWGMWQGEGKPVFNSLFIPFVKEMSNLRNTGFCTRVGEKINHYRAILLLGTTDLQAKAPLLGMAHHNGAFGCITCEEPGEVVKSGKGHSRYYPKRDQPIPLRTSESTYEAAVKATSTGVPEKGIKSLSPLFGMAWFDVIHGSVPDYMHGVLLGVVKKLTLLWFSQKHKKKPFSIMKHLKSVDDRLISMKPVDGISRLPRCINKNVGHWKACEYETWLLHYGIPCLQDVLPNVYLHHFALLVSGIHILLKVNISEEDLARAQESLSLFYQQFADLYGPENCGLNVHNVGEHLAFYVSLWGPMWAWSCFAFEDMNGFVLENVHGSGNVSVQALKMIQRQKIVCGEKDKLENGAIREFVTDMINPSRLPKKLKRVKDGFAAGRPQETIVKSVSLLQDISSKMENQVTQNDFYKVLRVVYHGQVYFSAEYSKAKRRNSHVVLVKDSIESIQLNVVDIQYFLCHKESENCFAIAKPLTEDLSTPQLPANVQHLKKVKFVHSDSVKAYPLSCIKEKVMYLDGNSNNVYISQIPNFLRLSN